MSRFTILLWAGYAIQAISPLVPVVAALASRRSSRFVRLPWMRRLALAVAFDLLVNWALLGMAIRNIHNAWFDNLTFLPEVGLSLWVLSGLGPSRFPGLVIVPTAAVLLGVTLLEAASTGLYLNWLTAMTTSSILLLGFCLWRLKEFIQQPAGAPAFQQPAFWVITAWTLAQGIQTTFNPLFSLFLRHLNHDLILVPWALVYLLGLVLNLILSRAFLCPKSTSSPAIS